MKCEVSTVFVVTTALASSKIQLYSVTATDFRSIRAGNNTVKLVREPDDIGSKFEFLVR